MAQAGLKAQRELFDIHPIRMSGFTLRSKSVSVNGKPTRDQWIAAAQFSRAAEESGPFWLMKLLDYLETREDWAQHADQMLAHIGGLTLRSAEQYRYVARNVPEDVRELAPSASHAAEVASLPPSEQRAFLKEATAQGMSRQELRRHIRTHKRTKVIEGQAVLKGRFRIWLADPCWSYNDSGPTEDGSLAKAEGAYPTMSMEELMKLPIEAHAERDAILFCWVTATMLLENPGPRDVIEAWGFKPKTGIVWDKVLGMPGHYGFQVKHEHVIIATRGSCLPDVAVPHEDSVLTIRRKGEHSEKPEELRKIIDKHWPNGNRVELFGRKPVEGWTVWGNDARLWPLQEKAQA